MPDRPSFFDPATRERIVSRLRTLEPDTKRRWGTMNAPDMVAHLTDQMTQTLGLKVNPAHRNLLRLPGMKYLSLYWVPWPRGLVKGPPEAFVTEPVSWDEDLDRLVSYVEAFAERTPGGEWPPHLLFGSTSGEEWGMFCYKHFDHHLRQFGV